MTTLNIIRASAGSGKTYRLAYDFIKRIIINPEMFYEILAVTFTNKATCQMKDRILSNLQNLKINPEGETYYKQLTAETGFSKEKIIQNAKKAQLMILADYNRFAISTIDKFFTKIVRSFFNELHKDPSYEVVISTDELIDQAIRDVILDERNDNILEPIFEKRINEEKNYDIKPEIDTIKGLVLRHENSDIDVDKLKEIFSNDKQEIETLKNDICTFANQIKGYLLRPGIDVSDYKLGSRGFANKIQNIAAGISFDTGNSINSAIEGNLYSKSCNKKEYIDSIRQKLINDLEKLTEQINLYTHRANTLELVEKNIDFIQIIKIIQQKFRDNCQRDHLLSINEMPNIVSDISKNQSLEFLYMKIDARLKSIMIDEFQDTSTEQWEGFRPILEEICATMETNKTSNLIIGDIKQAIYRWRGGNEALLRHIVHEQFNDYVKTDFLNKNFRSNENIIKFNNFLFEKIKENGIKCISFDGLEDIGEEINKLIESTYSDSKQEIGNETNGGYVECMFPENDNIVPKTIVEIINKNLQQGYSKKDIAVIIRNNSDAYDIAEIFSKNNIDFISGESLLLDNSNIVHKINVLLNIALNPNDFVKIAEYNICCDKEITEPLPGDIIQRLKNISSEPLIEAVATILKEIIQEDTGNETAFLDAFLDIVYQRQTKDSMSLVEFIKWWEENKSKCMLSSPEGQDAVTIITIHKSKGLEYPIVIAPRVNWSLIKTGNQKYMTADEISKYNRFGALPISFSKKCYQSDFKGDYLREIEQQIIDNINLLYVLVTRAKERLYMILPSSRTKSYNIRSLIQNILMQETNEGQDFLLKKDNDVYFYGEEKEKHSDISENTETDGNTELIETINPIEFERPLSKSSTFIESGNTSTKNLLQGILMHNVLSQIEYLDQLEDSVRKQCEIEAEDFNQFIPLINKIKSRPEMKEWFSMQWKHYTERSILIPGKRNIRRPDRVVVKGESAIVIDYKFGLNKFEKYSNQIREYMDLVSRLGFKQITGYIYYVSLDEVEEIK